MKDVVGFGALNVDRFFKVEDSQRVLEKIHSNRCCAEHGFVFDEIQSPTSFEELAGLLEHEGDLVGQSGGGSAANTIYALAKMGFRTGFIGRLGSDEEGDFLLREFESVGVDTGLLVRGAGRTGQCIATVDGEGERRLYVFPHENELLTREELNPSELSNTRFLHLTSFTGSAPLEAQKATVGLVRSDVRISLDPGQIYATLGLDVLQPLVERCYLIFAGKKEIEMLTGEEYEKGAKKLKQKARGVVCKLGSSGTHVFWGDDNFLVPALQVDAVDTTGAGDVYAAGFIAGLLLDQPVRKCAEIGTLLACQSIEGYGRQNYPDRKDLKGALGENS